MIRVLLVEDNPIEARLLRADFRKFGCGEFDLTVVQSLIEAGRVLREGPVDAVLLDLFLEDTAGIETLSRLRQIAPDAPVVVLTGPNGEAHALQALRDGAQDYLIKGTISHHVLFRVLRYAIERKHAEGERRVLEHRLLQAQKLEAVATLAGGVAHNFNNILMIILGHSNLALEQIPVNDGIRSHIESIQKAGERAALLTRQLLMFSRKQPVEAKVISLNKLVQDMQLLIESMLETQIELDLKLDPEIGFIKADACQIGQMLMNLVMNARNAMTNGGKLSIETSKQSAQILLMVTDTGCGMSAETCEHIFEPFFTTKGLAVSTGLGLSTAYGIIQQHGGSIQVSSRPGHGTSFSIAFPAHTRVLERAFTRLLEDGPKRRCELLSGSLQNVVQDS